MPKYLLFVLFPFVCSANASALQIAGECHDGLADGAYVATAADGVVRIEGSYARGVRQGEFTFYDPRGSRLIVLPYSAGYLDGTVRAWHVAGSGSEPDPVPKLVSDIRNGMVEGRHQTWYPDGSKRSKVEIAGGDVVSFETWSEQGAVLEIKDVDGFLNADLQGDFRYYENLERVLEAFPPQC